MSKKIRLGRTGNLSLGLMGALRAISRITPRISGAADLSGVR